MAMTHVDHDVLHHNANGNHCDAVGLQEGFWDIRGTYEDEFDDALNFNLGENTVSVITAILTSASLILFADVVFRIVVRAKKNTVSKRVVLRRHVLDVSSNPFSLVAMIMKAIWKTSTRIFQRQGNREQVSSPRKWASAGVAALGFVIICVEFLFILLATNQNKVYEVYFEQVPIFEFEDRGCELVLAGSLNSCSDQGPLTGKDGFDSRANLRICTTFTTSVREMFSLPLNVNELEISYSLDNHTGVHLSAEDEFMKIVQITKVEMVLENGRTYAGVYEETLEQQVLSAVLARLDRTNITVLSTHTLGESSGGDRSNLRFSLDDGAMLADFNTVKSVTARIDTSGVDLNQAFGFEAEMGNLSFTNPMMTSYLIGVMGSIMFPTAMGRGAAIDGGETVFLDAETTPLVYYNRPWLGIVVTLIVSVVLLLVWIVLMVLGAEDGVDSRWAWKEFFSDTYAIEDFEEGSDESQELSWRHESSGRQTFGFMPRV